MATRTLESPVVASGSGTVARPGEWSSITKRAFSTHVYDYWQNKAAENEAAGNSKWAVVNKIGSVVLQALTWLGATLGGFLITGVYDLGQAHTAWNERRVEALDAHKLTEEGIAEGLVKHGTELVKLDPNRGQIKWPFTSSPVASNVKNAFTDEVTAVTRALANRTDSMGAREAQAEIDKVGAELTKQVDAIAAKEGRDEDTGDVKYNLTMVSGTSAQGRLWNRYLDIRLAAAQAADPDHAHRREDFDHPVRMDQFIMTLVNANIGEARSRAAQSVRDTAEDRVASGSSLQNPDVQRDVARAAQRVHELTGADPVVVAQDIERRAKEKVEDNIEALQRKVGDTTPDALTTRLDKLKKMQGLGVSMMERAEQAFGHSERVRVLDSTNVSTSVTGAELRAQERVEQARAKGFVSEAELLRKKYSSEDDRTRAQERLRDSAVAQYQEVADEIGRDLGRDVFSLPDEIAVAEQLLKDHEALAAEQAKLHPPVAEDEEPSFGSLFDEEPVSAPAPKAEDHIEEEPELFDELPEREQEISSTRAYLTTAGKVLGGAAVVGGGIYGLYSYLRGGSQPVEQPYPSGTRFVNGTLTAPNGTQFRSTEVDKPKPGFIPIREEVIPEAVPPRVSIVRDSHGGTPTEEPLFRPPLTMPVVFPRVEETVSGSRNDTSPVVTAPAVEDRNTSALPMDKFSAVPERTPHVPSFVEPSERTTPILMSPANFTGNGTVV